MSFHRVDAEVPLWIPRIQAPLLAARTRNGEGCLQFLPLVQPVLHKGARHSTVAAVFHRRVERDLLRPEVFLRTKGKAYASKLFRIYKSRVEEGRRGGETGGEAVPTFLLLTDKEL